MFDFYDKEIYIGNFSLPNLSLSHFLSYPTIFSSVPTPGVDNDRSPTVGKLTLLPGLTTKLLTNTLETRWERKFAGIVLWFFRGKASFNDVICRNCSARGLKLHFESCSHSLPLYWRYSNRATLVFRDLNLRNAELPKIAALAAIIACGNRSSLLIFSCTATMLIKNKYRIIELLQTLNRGKHQLTSVAIYVRL